MNIREANHELYPHLGFLLYSSPYKLTYNEHKFQQYGHDINTCGRHVALRLACRHMPLEQYYRMIKKYSKQLGLNFDEFVTLLTMKI